MTRNQIPLLVLAAAAALLGGCDEGDDEIRCSEEPGSACRFFGGEIPGLGSDGLDPRETELYLPQDVGFGPDNAIYVIDWNNHRIRSIDGDGLVETVVGTGYLGDAPEGDADAVSLNHPTHIVASPTGKMVIAAWHNSKIMEYDPGNNHIVPICGTGKRAFTGDGGPAAMADLDLPVAVAFAPDGRLFISDQANQRIRVVGTDGIISTFAGNGMPGFSGDGGPAADAQISLPGGQAAPPAGRIVTDAAGNIFMADSGNHRIRKIDTAGVITTIAGDGQPTFGGDGGPAIAASLARPSDVAVDAEGNVFVADTDNSCVRKIAADGTIDTVIGECGTAGRGEDNEAAADFLIDRPYGVTLDDEGVLYVSDTHNHRIVAVYPD